MDYSTDYADGLAPGTHVRWDGSRGMIYVVLGRAWDECEPEPYCTWCGEYVGECGCDETDRGAHDRFAQSDDPDDWYTMGDDYVIVAVGDDQHHNADVRDLTPLDDDEHVCSCGQDGCTAENLV